LLFFAAGCSALPGLRVITGEDTQDDSLAAQAIENIDLVMADKTGSTDPSIIRAADRIEAALRGFDIIEIRNNPVTHEFTVNAMNDPRVPIASMDDLRRMIELTWRGTLSESEGSDKLNITILSPIEVNTLDRGSSIIGQVLFNVEIARSDAVVYLSNGPNINDFIGMILDETMTFNQPQTLQIYRGNPNHPMFALPDTSNIPNLADFTG